MNRHCKDTEGALTALDFRVDEVASRRGHRVWWHPNAPDRRVKTFDAMSNVAATKARNLASEIAGLSHSEGLPLTLGEMAKTRHRLEAGVTPIHELAARERAAAERQRCRNAAAWRQWCGAVEASDKKLRELRRLMMPEAIGRDR